MGGGPGDGGGRLDLDDLGAVIDGASRLEPSATSELLDDGRGRTWGDRLEEAGLTPWVRRHRRALVSVVAVGAVVAAGLTAYARLTPPALDERLAVTVTDQVPSGFVEEGDLVSTFDTVGIYALRGEVFRVAYGVSPTDPADTSTYEVLGLDGPAVRASSAHPQTRPTTGERFARDVDVVVDCFDRSSLLPDPGAYSLRVARTDAWGRTVVGSVPLDDSAVGWPAHVSSMCAGQQTYGSIELRSVSLRPGPTGRSVSLDLAVAGTLPTDVMVSMQRSGGSPAVDHTLSPTLLRAGETAVLPTLLEVADCAAPSLYRIGFDAPGVAPAPLVTAVPGATLTVDVIGHEDGSQAYPPPRALTPVYWSEATAREIDAALAAVCAGAPRAEVRVAAVGRTTQVDHGLPDGSHADTRIPLVLEVGVSTGSRVTVSSPEPAPQHFVGSQLATTSAAVRDGRARMTTAWSVDCASGGTAPPVWRVLVSTPRGDYPMQTTITSATLAREILATCPTADPQQLVDSGWDVPAS